MNKYTPKYVKLVSYDEYEIYLDWNIAGVSEYLAAELKK